MKKTYLTPHIKREISKVVNFLLKKYRNSDPFFIARELGIEYRFINFTRELLAFSERSSCKDLGTIYLNNNLGKYEQKLLCAHELAHLCLHVDDDSNLFDKDIDPQKEAEANYFVALLLPHVFINVNINAMSDEEINNYILHKINPFE